AKTHHIPDEVLHEILHALAFNTLLSSQETDAYSPVLQEAHISSTSILPDLDDSVKPSIWVNLRQPR
ncbi:hypothetical protein, partial [Nonomuraea endophytica]|uniref:hypothetical protein n=1 Tax=Nonomuraea endophytica TaxID=714136 RepID=UPI0037CC2012